MKKAKNLRWNSQVRKNETIVWKNSAGKILKRPDSRRYIIGEIRKRTKNGTIIVGYTNKKERGVKKPKAQRFSRIQRTFRETRKHRKPIKRKKIFGINRTFTVKSGARIVEQVPNWAVDSINAQIKINDFAAWGVNVRAKGVSNSSDISYSDQRLTYHIGKVMIASKIKEMLDNRDFRMSRKSQTDSEGRKRTHLRKLECQIFFASHDIF